ncbi:trypsin domain-containing protein [Phthorimaea operculella]|nr:trypsin domain-containing protein [Phthorimaea operculella]
MDNVVLLINHLDYYQSPYQLVHDVAVIHLQTFITFNALVRQALIAGPNYVLETDDPIQSIGWGLTGSPYQLVHDVAVIHLQTFITFNALVRQALIAGPNYVLETNDPIQSIGWGLTGSPYQLVHDVAVIHLQTFITFNALVRQALIAGPNYVLETDDPIQSIGWGMTGSPYQLVHDVAVIHLQTFITFNALVRQALIAGPNYVLETNDPIQSIGWGMTGSPYQLVHDVAVIHLQTFITFNALVRQALITGPNYVLETNDPIQSIVWGMTGEGFSEQLKHVQNRVFSREICQQTYQGLSITDEMLCIGSDNDEGICTGDSGGPNIHNDVVVGVTSFGTPACAQAGKPSVTARVSSYVPWILDNVFKN